MGFLKLTTNHSATLYFFILGAVLPIIAWLISRKWPHSIIVCFPPLKLEQLYSDDRLIRNTSTSRSSLPGPPPSLLRARLTMSPGRSLASSSVRFLAFLLTFSSSHQSIQNTSSAGVILRGGRSTTTFCLLHLTADTQSALLSSISHYRIRRTDLLGWIASRVGGETRCSSIRQTSKGRR